MKHKRRTRSRRTAPAQPTPEALDVLSGLELDVRRSTRVQTHQTLRQGRTPLQLIEIAVQATTRADQALAQAQQVLPPPRLACTEGCDSCCHLQVGASIPEVVRILAYLRQTLTLEEFEALKKRIRETAERKQHLTPAERRATPIACPLLANRRCLAYPVRPLTCRGFNSEDAELCEAFVEDRKVALPTYDPQMRLNTFALDGVRSGLAEAGLKSERVELTAALHIALESADAAERWLAGEPVFHPARLD